MHILDFLKDKFRVFFSIYWSQGVKTNSVQFVISSNYSETLLPARICLYNAIIFICAEWCGSTLFI